MVIEVAIPLEAINTASAREKGSVAKSVALRRDDPIEGGSMVMSDFKGHHLEGEIVLWAVRWYCRYGISYRDLEQMLAERE